MIHNISVTKGVVKLSVLIIKFAKDLIRYETHRFPKFSYYMSKVLEFELL